MQAGGSGVSPVRPGNKSQLPSFAKRFKKAHHRVKTLTCDCTSISIFKGFMRYRAATRERACCWLCECIYSRFQTQMRGSEQRLFAVRWIVSDKPKARQHPNRNEPQISEKKTGLFKDTEEVSSNIL